MKIITRKEAKAKGTTRYFTGKPCKHGHISERKVSSRSCVTCANALKAKRQKERYATDLAYKTAKKNFDANRCSERAKTEPGYRASEYKRLKKWRRENRGHANKLAADRRAAEAQATVPWGQKGIKEQYDFAQLMKKTFKEDFHVDHIIPLKHKKVCGLHTSNNLRVITSKENLKKSNKWSN